MSYFSRESFIVFLNSLVVCRGIFLKPRWICRLEHAPDFFYPGAFPNFFQDLLFHLPNPFVAYAKMLPERSVRQDFALDEPVAMLQDEKFLLVERFHDSAKVLAHHGAMEGAIGGYDDVVGKKMIERRIFFVGISPVKRKVPERKTEDPFDFFRFEAQFPRDFLGERFAIERLGQPFLDRHDLSDFDHRVLGNPHHVRHLRDSFLDCPADPVHRIGRKPRAARRIVPVNRLDEPRVPVLHEIVVLHSPIRMLSRDVFHEPEVCLDKNRPGQRVTRTDFLG